MGIPYAILFYDVILLLRLGAAVLLQAPKFLLPVLGGNLPKAEGRIPINYVSDVAETEILSTFAPVPSVLFLSAVLQIAAV